MLVSLVFLIVPVMVGIAIYSFYRGSTSSNKSAWVADQETNDIIYKKID